MGGSLRQVMANCIRTALACVRPRAAEFILEPKGESSAADLLLGSCPGSQGRIGQEWMGIVWGQRPPFVRQSCCNLVKMSLVLCTIVRLLESVTTDNALQWPVGNGAMTWEPMSCHCVQGQRHGSGGSAIHNISWKPEKRLFCTVHMQKLTVWMFPSGHVFFHLMMKCWIISVSWYQI